MASVKGFFKRGYWSSFVVASAGVLGGGWAVYVAVAVLLFEAVGYRWLYNQASDDIAKLAGLVWDGAATLRQQREELERVRNAPWN